MMLNLLSTAGAFLICLFGFSPAVTSAGTEEHEVKSFQRIKVFADNGQARAQHIIGTLYSKGSGVAQDHVQAVYWYRKSADQGDMLGLSALGFCYLRGEGVEKNLIEAYAYLKLAGSMFKKSFNDIEASMAPEQKLLAEARTKALFYELSAKLIKAKADLGDAVSQNVLGNCYATGEGVVKDDVEAYAYWKLAAEVNEGARKSLMVFETKLSADQIALGQKRAKELLKEIEARKEAKKPSK